MPFRTDLHRTFPDNEHFRCTDPETHRYTSYSVACVPKIHALRRVLLALSIYSPTIGYCQSLNFIAALLLLCTENEEHAFWIMVATTANILPAAIYDATMEDATVDQLTLLWLIFDRYPVIWSRISNDVPFWELEQKERPPPSALVTTHWFLTLFANVLPTEVLYMVCRNRRGIYMTEVASFVLQLPDLVILFLCSPCFVYGIHFFSKCNDNTDTAFIALFICYPFSEGHTVLFRVALALFEINSPALLNAEDIMEVFQIMQSLPKQAIDCNHLLDVSEFGTVIESLSPHILIWYL